MTLEISMKSNARLELGIGTVAADRQEWMYGVYFPAMGPVFVEHGLQTLAAFAVLASNWELEGGQPVQGSFGAWPSAQKHQEFHQDPRFLAVQEERDAAMEVFSFGHLFEALPKTISVDPERDYAVLIVAEGIDEAESLFNRPLADDSSSHEFAGKSIMLCPWNEQAQKLLEGPASEAQVLKIRFKG